MKITKSQLKQIIKEELEAVLGEDLGDSAIKGAWENFCKNRGTDPLKADPPTPHPDGETAEAKCRKERRKIRTTKGLDPNG
jgi:hypothetical protein